MATALLDEGVDSDQLDVLASLSDRYADVAGEVSSRIFRSIDSGGVSSLPAWRRISIGTGKVAVVVGSLETAASAAWFSFRAGMAAMRLEVPFNADAFGRKLRDKVEQLGPHARDAAARTRHIAELAASTPDPAGVHADVAGAAAEQSRRCESLASSLADLERAIHENWPFVSPELLADSRDDLAAGRLVGLDEVLAGLK